MTHHKIRCLWKLIRNTWPKMKFTFKLEKILRAKVELGIGRCISSQVKTKYVMMIRTPTHELMAWWIVDSHERNPWDQSQARIRVPPMAKWMVLSSNLTKSPKFRSRSRELPPTPTSMPTTASSSTLSPRHTMATRSLKRSIRRSTTQVPTSHAASSARSVTHTRYRSRSTRPRRRAHRKNEPSTLRESKTKWRNWTKLITSQAINQGRGNRIKSQLSLEM